MGKMPKQVVVLEKIALFLVVNICNEQQPTMLMFYKLQLLFYSISTISLTTASICDVSTPELDETYYTCVNLINKFNNCWEGSYNLVCSGRITKWAKRKCLNELQKELNKCQVQEIATYLTRLGSMMRSTDNILCELTAHQDFNNFCWDHAKSTTLLQAKLMMDGFDTSEGCGYRIIYSHINEQNSDVYYECSAQMNFFRSKWYELEPCSYFENTSDIYLPKISSKILNKCLQIQGEIDNCFSDILNCDEEQLESWKCFNDVLEDIDSCDIPILKINIRHRTETMKSAVAFLCKIDCPDLLRRDCFDSFKQLTLYSASAAKSFHSVDFCNFRKRYMDLIALTSPIKCHKVMEEYSNYMFEVAACVNITESFIHHERHDYQFDFDKSTKPLPTVEMFILGLIVIKILLF